MSDPAEDQMRQQMYKTMVALEKMADAITDYITADKRPAEQGEAPLQQPKAPTEAELEQMGRVVAKHHQALALLATYGQFQDAGFVGTQPDRRIAQLLGIKACENCVGTGWVARDETCKECGRTGYIKS